MQSLSYLFGAILCFKNEQNEKLKDGDEKRDLYEFNHKSFCYNFMWKVLEEELEM